MKTCQLIVVGMFLFNNISSQNLILNGSFENYTDPINCGGGGFDNYSVFPVNHVVDNWYSLNSVDYFNTVCGVSGYGVPESHFGSNNAKLGNAFAGFEVVYNNSETKEYIYQQLSSPLQAGKIYCLSFFVSRADRISYAIKNIGAYFSNNVQTTGSISYINAIPQVVNQSGFITDTTQWIEVQGCFTAIGGEQYVTLGNFNSNANTDTLRIQPMNPISTSTVDIAYYYIDDISLIDQTSVGVNELGISVITVYPNPTTDILQIDLGTIKENTQVKIYNALGELVLIESLTTQNSSLKTHHLISGIYFYHILVGDKIIETDKIVIIK